MRVRQRQRTRGRRTLTVQRAHTAVVPKAVKGNRDSRTDGERRSRVERMREHEWTLHGEEAKAARLQRMREHAQTTVKRHALCSKETSEARTLEFERA